MRNQFLQMLNSIEKADMATAPGYVTLLALAKHPKVEYPNPELVAATIPIEVGEDFVVDKELFNRTVDVYVIALNRIWHQLRNDFELIHAERMFMKMVESMSLTYKL